MINTMMDFTRSELIVCLNNIGINSDSYGEPIHDELPFTLGKVYQSLETPFKGVYKIVGDDNLMYVVNKNSFTTLQLWREHKIDLILK